MARRGTTTAVYPLCSGAPAIRATNNICRSRRWTSHRHWQRWLRCPTRPLTGVASTSTPVPVIPARLPGLLFDEGVDVACQDDHGDIAAFHYRIIKQPKIKFVA